MDRRNFVCSAVLLGMLAAGLSSSAEALPIADLGRKSGIEDDSLIEKAWWRRRWRRWRWHRWHWRRRWRRW